MNITAFFVRLSV